MELRHFKAFIAVAEELHFGRAAKRLFMTQQPLSRTIADLEDKLGTSLFNRTTRQVTLTDAGHTFLREARTVITRYQEALETMHSFKEGTVGRLEIGYTGPAWWAFLPEVLRLHRERYPKLELVTSEMYTHLQLESLERGAIHLGFLHPPFHSHSETLHHEVLLSEPVMVVLPETHPLACCERIPLEQLRKENFIFFPRTVGSALYDDLLSLCQEAGFRPTIAQELLPQQARVEMVARNHGVTFASHSTQTVGTKGVVFRKLEGRNPEIPLAVAWPKKNLTLSLERLLEIVREVVSKLQNSASHSKVSS